MSKKDKCFGIFIVTWAVVNIVGAIVYGFDQYANKINPYVEMVFISVLAIAALLWPKKKV